MDCVRSLYRCDNGRLCRIDDLDTHVIWTAKGVIVDKIVGEISVFVGRASLLSFVSTN